MALHFQERYRAPECAGALALYLALPLPPSVFLSSCPQIVTRPKRCGVAAIGGCGNSAGQNQRRFTNQRKTRLGECWRVREVGGGRLRSKIEGRARRHPRETWRRLGGRKPRIGLRA